jgi:hypothetical protein
MPIAVLLGTVFVVAGVWLLTKSVLSLRQATIVTGEVEYLDQVELPTEGGTAKSMWPVIRFQDSRGEVRRIVDPHNPFRRPGDSVRIMYSALTGEAKIYSLFRLWLPGAALACAGMGLITSWPS